MGQPYPLRYYLGKKLSEAQLDVVDLIERSFTDAGYSRDFAAMAVANAYAESKLVPTAVLKTSKEDSAGLFMLNKKGGLGIGMPVGVQYPDGDSRKDPQLNVERILKAIKESPATQKDIKNSLNDWRNIMDVWVHRIERPNGKHFEVVSRLNMAAMLFPQGIVGPPVDQAGALAWETPDTKQTAKDPEQASDTNPWVGRILITCGALIGVTWYARWRAKQGSPLPGFPALRS